MMERVKHSYSQSYSSLVIYYTCVQKKILLYQVVLYEYICNIFKY